VVSWTVGKHVKQSMLKDEWCAELVLEEVLIRKLIVFEDAFGA
jgi:hypothetical protein